MGERAAGGPNEREALSAPAVPPDVYDDHYYRNMCLGSSEWSQSGGKRFSGVYEGFLALAGLEPGQVIVDIGTGRGELLAVAVERGAARAIGVEYSEAAVALARETIAVHGVADRAEVHLADARDMPVEDGTADLVSLLDVVEHLAPDELDRALAEARRVLKPGGRVVIHTMPNRTIYEVTYRLQRWLWPPRLVSWPADPRNDYERRMHVNEQTVGSLRKAIAAAGLEPRVWLGDWVYAAFVPSERARRLYHRLASRRLTERFGKGDLWAEGRKPAS
jgi:ubiquinone/menaquinone biosynthesis C-methylase UbiE